MGMMKGKGKDKGGKAPPPLFPMGTHPNPQGAKGKGAGDWQPRVLNAEGKEHKPPDPSKSVFEGQVVRRQGENGFIACEDTMAVYQRDVYMWKTYFNQVELGDYCKFQVHISDKGLPQVCWLQRISGGVVPPDANRPAQLQQAVPMKRPGEDPFEGPAKRPAGMAPTMAQF